VLKAFLHPPFAGTMPTITQAQHARNGLASDKAKIYILHCMHANNNLGSKVSG